MLSLNILKILKYLNFAINLALLYFSIMNLLFRTIVLLINDSNFFWPSFKKESCVSFFWNKQDEITLIRVLSFILMLNWIMLRLQKVLYGWVIMISNEVRTFKTIFFELEIFIFIFKIYNILSRVRKCGEGG